MILPVLDVDCETRSTVDLRKTGMYVYAEHPTTDVWVMCWSLNGGPVQAWFPGQPCPETIVRHIKRGHPIFAHNAMFERCIWKHILTPRHGWPLPPLELFHCTAAMAAAMALPRDLERACLAMGLDVQKDMAGRRLMLQMAKPRSVAADGTITWWNVPEKLGRLTAYCKQDVRAQTALRKKVLHLSPEERKLWLLDCKINERGIRVDSEYVEHAWACTKKALNRFNEEIARITRGEVSNVTKRDDTVYWLEQQGVSTDSIDKANVIKLLGKEISPTVRRVLEIRQEAAKSSTAKLEAYRLRTCEDGRLRELLMYHGASTGRWTAKGVQLQNLPDPARVGIDQSTIDAVFEMLPRRDADLMEAMYGQIMTLLSCCLRGMLIAEDGHKLISADFSNIEGRGLAWLAGERRKLRAFEAFDRGDGPDLYKVAASGIYGIPVDKIDKLQRQVGKVAELACGYQGGVNAFNSMAKNYNMDMSIAYPNLWERQTAESRAKLEERYGQYSKVGKKDEEDLNVENREEIPEGILSREVWMASEITKRLWRDSNPLIVSWWYDLEDAVFEAVRNKGAIVTCRSVQFRVKRNVLWCRLPSGRKLAYVDPKEKIITTPWGAKKLAVTFMGVHPKTKQWTRQKAYGGLWAENITQAFCRDILAAALLRVEAAGYPVVLSVHDEGVSEVPEDYGSVTEYEELMVAPLSWAPGLPMAAEGWTARRYKK